MDHMITGGGDHESVQPVGDRQGPRDVMGLPLNKHGGGGAYELQPIITRPYVSVWWRQRTDALLEALSSSLLVGGAAPLRERGEEAGALRRDLGGFA